MFELIASAQSAQFGKRQGVRRAARGHLSAICLSSLLSFGYARVIPMHKRTCQERRQQAVPPRRIANLFCRTGNSIGPGRPPSKAGAATADQELEFGQEFQVVEGDRAVHALGSRHFIYRQL
jgi:hypothetical protein